MSIIYISLLVSSIIPFLILGPFFPDLIVSLSSLVFLIYVFKNKLFFYLNKKPLIIFFIFCTYCILVSIFVAKDILLSFESSLFYFRIGLFSCLIWYLVEQDKKVLNYFYYALLISFLALIVDGYIQFFTGTNILGFPIQGSRLSSFFGNELIMGSYLSRLFPLLFALFILKKKKNYEIGLIGFLFILVDILIYISGERVGFFFLTLSNLFIIILIKRYQIFRLVVFLIASVFIIMVSLADDKIINRMIFQTLKQTGIYEKSQTGIYEKSQTGIYEKSQTGIYEKSEDKINIFSPDHDSLIKTAYNIFLDKPIFGHGPKMFRVLCKEEKYAVGIKPCLTHPHNFYVQLLAETGIIGFSFLLSAFAYVLYCAYRQFKSIVLKQKRYLTDYQVCLLSGILITVWPLAPNGNFFNNWLIIVYSLPVGFYLHSLYGKNKDEVYKNIN